MSFFFFVFEEESFHRSSPLPSCPYKIPSDNEDELLFGRLTVSLFHGPILVSSSRESSPTFRLGTESFSVSFVPRPSYFYSQSKADPFLDRYVKAHRGSFPTWTYTPLFSNPCAYLPLFLSCKNSFFECFPLFTDRGGECWLGTFAPLVPSFSAPSP